MRIRLKNDVPVGKEHGMVEGREFEVLGEVRGMYMVKGDAGELVHIFKRECEEVE